MKNISPTNLKVEYQEVSIGLAYNQVSKNKYVTKYKTYKLY